MRELKRLRRLGVLFAVSLSLAACGAKAQPDGAEAASEAEKEEETAEAVYLSLVVCGDWTDSAQGEILTEQVEKLAENPDGGIHIRVYDRGRLGGDLQLIHGVSLGTLDMTLSVPGMQTSVVPEAALLEIPGLFDSLDQWNRFLTGPYLEVMREYYSAAGLRLLMACADSYRVLSSSREVSGLSELAGLRVRVIENEYHEAFWNSLGAQAVPYSFGELRFCLQEEIAQAQENPISTVMDENLIDLQPFVTVTDHLPMIFILAMNEETYESLTAQEQELVTDFAEKLREELIRQMPEREERVWETLQNDYGITVTEPAEDLKEQIRQGGGVVLELLRTTLGDGKTDRMLEEAERIRAVSGQ